MRTGSALRAGAALLLVGALIAPGTPTPAGAATARLVSGWVPYWDSTDGRAAFADPTTATMFDDISPFFASVNGDGQIGTLNTTSLTATINAARAKGLTVLPTLTDGTGGQMATLLADPAWRAAHIAAIVAWVNGLGVDGADLDYEDFAFVNPRSQWPTIQPLWVTFVGEVSAALHGQGKLLAVTIPPEWGSSSDYWVYAQDQIWPAVDRIRLMAYEWSGATPGPTAPLSWDDQVIAESDRLVGDRSKLQLGIPAYGKHWTRKVNSGELCPTGTLSTKSVSTAAAPALAAAYGVTPQRDPNGSGEMTFGWTETVTGPLVTAVPAPPYTPLASPGGPVDAGAGGQPLPALRLGTSNMTVTCTVRHTVYFPDAQVAAARAQKAKDAGWRGVVIWALGSEDQATRDALFGVATS